jgi:peptidylprolyl isomerase
VRHRLTRLRPAPVALVVAVLVLGGCGNASSGSTTDTPTTDTPTLGVSAVHVSGDVGTSATVSFDGAVTDTTAKTTVATAGSGSAIGSGDTVVAHIVIADGATQKTAENSYDQHAPQVFTITSQIPGWLQDAVQGKKVGTRVVVYAPSATIFGAQGNPSLGIGTTDMVVVVLDLVGKALGGPNGASHAAPSWAPQVQSHKGVVSGLGFSHTPKPDGKLHAAALRAGTGATVKKGQTIVVNYLGAVYQGKTPFDESFSKAPVGFPIGVQQVVVGWDKTLVGQKVGSEVVLQIPPADGYGKQAKSGIPANSTLYFVVDILGAY